MTEENEQKSWLDRISETLMRDPHNRNELITIIREAKGRALIDQEALQMIEGVLRVAEMHVDDVMIPRPEMTMIEADMTAAEALPIITASNHSRFPVFDTSLDKVVGILLAKDLLQLLHLDPKTASISPLIRPATFIPASKRLNVLLKEFRLRHNHMAIVVDEYGNVDGLVTIEDVLEQIVGNIEDEYDADDVQQESGIQQLEPRVTLVNARTSITAFNSFFGKNLSDEEFDTIGGIVLQAFSHLPKCGETVEIEDLEFTVLEASERGIQKLRVYRNPPKD